jgi:hypothetical protein
MPDDRHVRPFAEWLQEHRNGLTQSELSDAYNDLIEAVHEHGKMGSLTFTVKVKPAARDAHMVVVVDDIKVKKPEGERGEAIYFIDEHSNLTRHNPAQPSLPLREVPKAGDGAADLKEAK